MEDTKIQINLFDSIDDRIEYSYHLTDINKALIVALSMSNIPSDIKQKFINKFWLSLDHTVLKNG